MKKLFLSLVFFAGAFILASAQNLPDFSSIPLNSKADYNVTANSAALKAASYILSTPPNNKNTERNQSAQYLLTWMTGTSFYTFSIDKSLISITENDPELLMIVMAAMAHDALTNKNYNTRQTKNKAVKTLIAYVSNPANNAMPNKELKKAIKADKKGRLVEYLAQLNE